MQTLISRSPAALFFFVTTIGASLFLLFVKPELVKKYALSPYEFVYNKHYGMIVTSGFIHGSLQHLMFNMITFYFFAFALEPILGSVQFVILYFSSLMLSDVYTIIKHKDNEQYSCLGASGAISAVLFSYIIFYPFHGIGLLFIPIYIPAVIFGFLYLAYCMYASRRMADHINHDAHFFGALTGIVLTVILRPDAAAGFISQLTAFFNNFLPR